MRSITSTNKCLTDLGRRFKKRRTMMNIKITTLADAADISPRKLSEFEKTGVISTEDLVVLCTLTGTATEFNRLFNRKKKPPRRLYARLAFLYASMRQRATGDVIPHQQFSRVGKRGG